MSTATTHARAWDLFRALLAAPIDPATGRRPHVLVHGPAGTGKTTSALAEHAPTAGIIALQAAPGVSLADVLGQVHLRDGSTAFRRGPAADAMTRGARLVVDEIDRASDDLMTMLYRVTDGHALTLPDGSTITPAAVQVVATTNEEPTAFMPPALLDRFYVIRIDAPSSEALAGLPEAWRTVAGNAVSNGMSGLRAWYQLHYLLTLETDREYAAEVAFGGGGVSMLDALDIAAGRRAFVRCDQYGNDICQECGEPEGDCAGDCECENCQASRRDNAHYHERPCTDYDDGTGCEVCEARFDEDEDEDEDESETDEYGALRNCQCEACNAMRDAAART